MLESYSCWVVVWLGIESPREWCVPPISQVNGSFDTPYILTRENSLVPRVEETEDFGTSDSHNSLDARG